MIEPRELSADERGTLLAYLDDFRATVRAETAHLTPEQAATSVLPSGWTIAGLVTHLAHMERRWLVWGFLGEPVAEPWGDADDAGGWRADVALADSLQQLDEGGTRTHEVVGERRLDERARPGGRFAPGEEPTLRAILFHVHQEYARHLGHLDAAVELLTGRTGE